MAALTTDSISSLGLTNYGSTSTTQTTTDSLGRDDFLTLFITQLNNQDPTDPVKNEDFVAQLAQFSTVSGIEDLNTAFDELSQTLTQNQALEAASLVGNQVTVSADSADLSEGQGISGAVSLPASADAVTVEVSNEAGEVVRTLDLGTLSSGLQEFDWDGLLEDGSAAPAGTYQFKVTADNGGTTETLDPMLKGEVQSVSLDSDGSGLTLSVLGLGSKSFSDVYRIE